MDTDEEAAANDPEREPLGSVEILVAVEERERGVIEKPDGGGQVRFVVRTIEEGEASPADLHDPVPIGGSPAQPLRRELRRPSLAPRELAHDGSAVSRTSGGAVLVREPTERGNALLA